MVSAGVGRRGCGPARGPPATERTAAMAFGDGSQGGSTGAVDGVDSPDPIGGGRGRSGVWGGEVGRVGWGFGLGFLGGGG